MNEIQGCLNVACQSILRASHMLETDLLISGIEIRRAIHELRRAQTLIMIETRANTAPSEDYPTVAEDCGICGAPLSAQRE